MSRYISILGHAIALALLVSGCLQPSERKRPDPVRVDVRYKPPGRQPPPIQPPSLPGFYALDVLQDTVITDLNGITSNIEREDTRFADGCDRYNSDEELEEFKRGFDKALNHLSTEIDPEPSVAIGAAGCIFRYQLSDYGIDLYEYQLLEDRTVLQEPRIGCSIDEVRGGYCTGQLTNITTRGLTIQALTQTLRPVLNADDIITAAFESDQLTDHGGTTYYEIIEQQFRRVDFLANEGIDIQEQFDDRTATFGGVNDSGVARGSRLIINLESINGRTRYSEDSSNVDPDNINNSPFIDAATQALRDGDVVRIDRSDKEFNAVAREYIGDLPNGCNWYRIEDAANDLGVSVVPITVASSGRHDFANIDSQIRPGMCMDCHENSIQPWTDTLSRHIANTAAFLSDEKTIATDFIVPIRINQYQRSVASSYARRCLQPLGIDPGDRDPTNARLLNPFRDEVTVREAAGKFRLTPQQYLACLEGSQIGPALLGSHLNGGTVALNDFAEAYPIVIEECNLNEDS